MDEKKHLLEQSYEAHADALFRFCYFKVSNREKAKDLLQDIYVRAWSQIQKNEPIGNMRALLYTIARNLIIDEYRKKKAISLDKMVEDGLEFSVNNQESIHNYAEIQHALVLLKKLPPDYNEVLQLRFVDDMSVQDIAVLLNTSENVISVRVYRALDSLRKLMTPSTL
jgi:RNA polymerase sigma-70 factor (ECF subfamily)